jgi:cytochrome d ubiquinol oxidase subunit II
LRGTAFVFRKYDSKRDSVQQRWSLVFGISSLVTPVVQGMALGALATGDIREEKSVVSTGFLAGWLSPFAWACGVFALVLFAFLAATYLTLDAAGEPEVQNDFRVRALWSEVALAPIAAAVFFTSREEAPELFRGLTNWWAPWLLIVTSVCAVTALVALGKRAYKVARVAAIGQVTTILLGWCLAQFPHLIYPDVTITNAAAPQITLKLLMIALAAGTGILLPSLYYLFKVFKGKEQGE